MRLCLPGLFSLTVQVDHFSNNDTRVLELVVGGRMPRLKNLRMSVLNLHREEDHQWLLFENQPAVFRIDTPALSLVEVEITDDKECTPPNLDVLIPNIIAAFQCGVNGPKIDCEKRKISRLMPL
jgi:hypothetical protein